MEGFNCCSGAWVQGYAEATVKAKQYAVEKQITVVVYLKEGKYYFIPEANWVRTDGTTRINTVTPFL